MVPIRKWSEALNNWRFPDSEILLEWPFFRGARLGAR
jgi:hypothetical protein